MRELGQCLDESYIDLGSPRLALQRDTLGFTRAKLHICAAFWSGTGLKSLNSQTCSTRFRVSDSNVLTLSTGISVRLTHYSHWNSCLKWFIGVKNSQIFIQTNTSTRLQIIARWGHLPISMVLRSERNLKSKMLSLARTSKYVNDTSVLGKKSEADS